MTVCSVFIKCRLRAIKSTVINVLTKHGTVQVGALVCSRGLSQSVFILIFVCQIHINELNLIFCQP